ncbi:ring-hydroxylating dioxygenase ferredoxin reductase family protein [Pseudomonas sp. 5Ae-yellow]|uniref:ring-hydroxylating dioxygenase ferredoxin reductase family protein n=1 Tax=Pseudomonas sp. 5Ae-yellow TaxID=2759848 RepID=UPI0015F5DF5A|nr:ring-hydroxylating dioxygenase ferredoxin reductase family protein [Pseudomonas sp. 5Ae-yellow]MBA6420992.1 ring-hydroxylating dioxygenase ferredoxin reductase family protein [Pseudomonas sp. 5Ae-yellow]
MKEQIHQVTVNFSDGISRSFDVEAGSNIIDAAIEAEIPLLYQCRSGSCSTCIAQLAEGEAKTRAGASSTLLGSEYASGQRLLCVCQAQSDCTFEVPYGSEVGTSAAHEVHTFVDSVERIASNVMRLTLELADGEWVEFRPGQFMQIQVPGFGVVRSYSPSSTATAVPKMEFLIRLLPGGAMSSYLEEKAAPDEVLSLTGPYGAFFLREESRRAPHIFVAGGTGLAPILSMIDSLRQGGGRKPPMLLSFGCLNPQALFCMEDIELRQQWLPSLDARICVDQDPKPGMHHGNPVSALREGDVTSPDTVAYLCGPQPMIDAATRRLVELGVNPTNIFAEQFVASN